VLVQFASRLIPYHTRLYPATFLGGAESALDMDFSTDVLVYHALPDPASGQRTLEWRMSDAKVVRLNLHINKNCFSVKLVGMVFMTMAPL
jgi:hypothetical protein